MLKRRDLLLATATAALPAEILAHRPASAATPLSRVRPGEPGWPSDARWGELHRDTGGRLFRIVSPLATCNDQPDGRSCSDVFRQLQNPYFIGDDPALTQTSGWVDAWTAQPSTWAVAAETAADVAAGVDFDPDGVFFARHGVGSEAWSEDGFTRLMAP